MKILAIETSCDETGVSILECTGGITDPFFRVIADSLATQIEIHKEYGGVFPALAKREHIKNLPILLAKTLKKAKLNLSLRSLSQADGPRMSKNSVEFYTTPQGQNLTKPPIDAICVTSGPGLEPALWTGIVFAKELAKKWGVPLVPVNHMEGHILSVFGKQKGAFKIPVVEFPALSLLVSGGHTELVLVKDWMKYKVIGETVDDAAGEAFDKVARMMGLPYPGGPEISKLAEAERKSGHSVLESVGRSDGDGHRKFSAENFSAAQNTMPAITLPRPMMYSKNFNFSFSGLKTAVLYLIRKIAPLDDKMKSAIALEFENAVVETLCYKTKKAIEKYDIKTLIVAGGVASNKHLRNEIKKIATKNTKVLFPVKELSTDNSVMIGIVGYMQFLKKKGKFGNGSRIKANGGMRL